MVEWNPFSHADVDDPFPIYRRLRDEQPVYHNEKLKFYAFSRFDDVRHAFLHPGLYKSSHGVTLETANSPDALLNKDDPDHLQHRKAVAKYFTVSAVQRLEDSVRTLAADLLDAARDRDVIDVLDDFAVRLPIAVICQIVGVPAKYHEEILEHTLGINVAEATDDDPRPTQAAAEASMRLHGVITEMIAEVARDPHDDALGALLQTSFDDFQGGTYTLNEAQAAIRTVELVGAGFDTTSKQIANAVIALAWYPDQRAELAADPSLMATAVDELVRWDPGAHYTVRYVEEDVELHGTTIPADNYVVVMTASANHDERVFENPEYLDIRRPIDMHMGFAFGTHLCLGAALTRLELRVALEELLRRYPNYELAGPGERQYAGNVRGLKHLPVLLDPAS